MYDDDEDELNDDEEFESEDEKRDFQQMFHQYRESKKMMEESMRIMAELQNYLHDELFNKKKRWVMIPEKFIGTKNCPVCMIKFEKVFNGLLTVNLN